MRSALLPVLGLLTACQTGYVKLDPRSPHGYGHTVFGQVDDEYRVSFRGNRLTSHERARYFAEFRAVQYGLHQGYTFVRIQNVFFGNTSDTDKNVYGTYVELSCRGFQARPAGEAIDIGEYLDKNTME